MGFLLLIGLIAAVDLVIKAEIEARDIREFPKPLEITKGKIILHQSHNAGFPFEVLKNRPELVRMLPIAVISGLFGILGFLIPRKGFWMEKLALALTLGGAISNLYDRLTKNYVVDYFSIDWKGLKKVIFNFGDICIFAGAILMVAGQVISGLWQMGKKAAKYGRAR